MHINRNDYIDKVAGCWLGKNIGGTVGMPFEWKRQINNISFYTQDLKGEPIPNDDLDIQLIWLIAMEERGIDIDAHTLAEYWCFYVGPHWAEYGAAKINMRQGLQPPITGMIRNPHKHSCGAFIRAEIWACIAPGLPGVAARYAYEDAILDHGDGEGTFGEVFIAALESAAFVISDLRALIDIGLSYIPRECGVAKAIKTAVDCFDSGKGWKETRDEILRHHRGKLRVVSEEDRKKGFHEGTLGYDVPSNIAILILGLLEGADDFGKVMCTTVNCGEDTDCTAATAGSIWGMMRGASAIPQKWIDPIGRELKTVSINLGDLGCGRRLPQDVDEFTERTDRIARQVLLRNRKPDMIGDGASDLSDVVPESFMARDQGESIWGGMSCPRFDFDFFTIHVDYGKDGPFISDEIPRKVKITIRNRSKFQANLAFQWYLPDTGGWRVDPSSNGYIVSTPFDQPDELEWSVSCERVIRPTERAVLEITAAGRPMAMLLPIVFINGNSLSEDR